jgi:hypothetical protein
MCIDQLINGQDRHDLILIMLLCGWLYFLKCVRKTDLDMHRPMEGMPRLDLIIVILLYSVLYFVYIFY